MATDWTLPTEKTKKCRCLSKADQEEQQGDTFVTYGKQDHTFTESTLVKAMGHELTQAITLIPCTTRFTGAGRMALSARDDFARDDFASGTPTSKKGNM